ncbi:hypothetical protein BD408DRAFT_424520 [Parasitella parasitica]|nr:hypothetical protein BD408DRAFT_424520 [Parasitella parasitica]
MKSRLYLASIITVLLCLLGVYATTDQCEANKKFKADDGCNTCLCPENGLKANAPCTRLACAVQNEQTCIPGVRFIKVCNTCLCPRSGLKAEAPCSKMACL